MKLSSIMVFSMCALFLAPAISGAQQEYTGTLESRPEGAAGTWVIGGRKIEATDTTTVEAEYGPVEVGGCVVVEYAGTRVAFIKSEEAQKCAK
jgi:hypothetical protein